MPDARKRFVPLQPQALIQPLEEEPEAKAESPRAGAGLPRRLLEAALAVLAEILGGLLPYLLVTFVLVIAVATFFGISVKAAIIMLGLGAVGLGVLFAMGNGR